MSTLPTFEEFKNSPFRLATDVIPKDEEWRAIPGYEGLYEISNVGRVRSLSRVVKGPRGTRKLKGKVLKLLSYKARMVELSKDNVQKKWKIADLIGLTF